MSLFDMFRGTPGKQPATISKVKEPFPELLPQIPDGAVKLGHDTKKEMLYNQMYAQALEKMNQNLVPILSALSMLTLENLYKYSYMDGRQLAQALRDSYTAEGGSPYFFDELQKNEEFRNKFTLCGRLPQHVWPYITIEKCEDDQKEWYPADYVAVLHTDKLKPFYDVWIWGAALEKHKKHLELIEELNSFFEKGATRDLLMKYFGGGLSFTKKIGCNVPGLLGGLYPYADTIKGKEHE